MHFIFSLFLIASPVFAQQQEEPIKRIDIDAIMNEITVNSSGRLDLSVKQEKNIRNALKKSSKKFDKAMKNYEKNRAEEAKWRNKAEADLKEMKTLSEDVNDLIVETGHLDNAQKEKFAAFLAEKEKAASPDLHAKEAAQPADSPDVAPAEDNSAAMTEAAPVSEEAKTVSEKKRRVVLKKKNRRKAVNGGTNLVPAGSKGGAKPRVSRKAESDLPSSVVPVPGGSSVPKPQNSAVPSL